MRITEKDQIEIHRLAEIAALKSRILDLERDGERLANLLCSFVTVYEACDRCSITGVERFRFLAAQKYLSEREAAIASQKPDGGGKGK